MTSEMMCPVCRTKLQSTETFQYEDVMCYKVRDNKWMCSNTDCVCCQKETCWNGDGDFFSGGSFEKMKEVFPDNNYAALNSLAKKCEIEIYGKGLKRKIYLSPWLMLLILEPMIEFNYKSDEMGNVLGRSWSLKFLYKDQKFDLSWIKNTDGYNTYYTSGFSLLKYCLSIFYRKLKHYKENNTVYSKLELNEEFDKSTKNEKLYKKVYLWYIKTFYKKLSKKLLEYKHFDSLIPKSDYISFECGDILEQNTPDGVNLEDELIKRDKKGEYMERIIRKRKFERILKKL